MKVLIKNFQNIEPLFFPVILYKKIIIKTYKDMPEKSLGMSREDGTILQGDVHILQSIKDIMTTRRGERVMLPEYGSDIPALLDAPMNNETIAQIYAATVEALDRWEPRVKISRMQVLTVSAGIIEFQINGVIEDRAFTANLDLNRNK